jgi:hypothetical protein
VEEFNYIIWRQHLPLGFLPTFPKLLDTSFLGNRPSAHFELNFAGQLWKIDVGCSNFSKELDLVKIIKHVR